MKKVSNSVLLIVLILGLLTCAGCKKAVEKTEAQTGEQTEEQVPAKPAENQFDAKILEVQDEYLMVEALEGQTIAGEVQVWTGLLSTDDIPKLEEGMVVRITHDGKMTMSIPPHMSAEEIIMIQ